LDSQRVFEVFFFHRLISPSEELATVIVSAAEIQTVWVLVTETLLQDGDISTETVNFLPTLADIRMNVFPHS